MESYLRRLWVLLTMLLAVSCNSMNADQIEFSDWWKETWPKDLVHGCHSLSGTYEPRGEVYVKGGDGVNSSGLESIFGIYDLEQDSQAVVIEQKSGFDISASVIGHQGNVLHERTFDVPYSCEKPWILYESYMAGSGDGSSHISTRTLTRIARSQTSELIVSIQTTTISSVWFFSRKAVSREVLHVFTEK